MLCWLWVGKYEMDCLTAKNHLSGYYDGELAVDAAALVRAHIDECADCRKELAAFERTGTLVAAAEVPVSSSGHWAGILILLEDESRPDSGFSPGRTGIQFRVTAVVFAACLLLGLGIWRFGHRGGEVHEDHAEMAVNLGEMISRFASDPVAAIDKLSTHYQGVEVSLDTAESLLGYRPEMGNNLPAGYQLTSTRVVKMPCCTCSVSICTRQDGSTFAVFEHNEEQPLWFGDAPSISAKCGGRECSVVEMPEQLAVTWKSGMRQMTAIGVAGLEEIASLMAAVDNESSAG